MIRKICPICEQTMKLSHYCKNCGQFVKSPYVRDITYYLNERHPEGEKNCDYHGVPQEKSAHGEKKWLMPKAARPQASAPVYSLPENRQKARKVWGTKRAVYGAAGAMVLIQLIGAAKNLIENFYIPVNRDQEEEFTLLSDEEVQDSGIECSSNGHYSVSGSLMAKEMERIVGEAGYDIDSVETSSWNYAETGEDSYWTDYETTVGYYMSLAGSGEEDVETDSAMVNYDTATGRLHGINFYVSDPARGAFMTEAILDFLQEQGEIPADEDYGVLTAGEILEYSDSGEDEERTGQWKRIPEDGEQPTEVYFHETDGAFYVRIWRVWD